MSLIDAEILATSMKPQMVAMLRSCRLVCLVSRSNHRYNMNSYACSLEG